MSEDYDYDAPDHCTVEAIGEVGHRLFLFVCRQGLIETTVKVEKQQIAVLAGYLGRIVRELGRPGQLPEDLDFYGTEEYEWVVGHRAQVTGGRWPLVRGQSCPEGSSGSAHRGQGGRPASTSRVA